MCKRTLARMELKHNPGGIPSGLSQSSIQVRTHGLFEKLSGHGKRCGHRNVPSVRLVRSLLSMFFLSVHDAHNSKRQFCTI